MKIDWAKIVLLLVLGVVLAETVYSHEHDKGLVLQSQQRVNAMMESLNNSLRTLTPALDACFDGKTYDKSTGNVILGAESHVDISKSTMERCVILIGDHATVPPGKVSNFLNIDGRFCANLKTKQVIACPVLVKPAK
jgi:hypothetical protein